MFAVLGTVVNVLILFHVARRLLGVPVGWGRTVLISAAIMLVPYAYTEPLLAQFGIHENTPVLPMVHRWAATVAGGGAVALPGRYVAVSCLHAGGSGACEHLLPRHPVR
ncbi:MAG: hypothetical protein Q4G35_06575 [Propionibacteriaceae bacterium]|nr:hypothetical protein [Propionibacteriaceae bacterium]